MRTQLVDGLLADFLQDVRFLRVEFSYKIDRDYFTSVTMTWSLLVNNSFSILYFRFVKQDQICVAKFQTAGIVCMETFAEFPQMGRFTLRDEGRS